MHKLLANYALNDSPELQIYLTKIMQLHPQEIDLGLDRVREVAKRLDVLTLQGRVITVTGTNGKGSCVRYLETIAHLAGLRVAAYTSPHLLHFAERIRIGTHPVADAAVCEALARVESARGNVSLTYFEYTTLAALYLFKQADLDLVILEVGLGGRLDAVNIIDCDIAVITSIGIDHIEWLGDSRASIALEKAGIFRTNKPAVIGDPHIPQELRHRVSEQAIPLWAVNEQFTYQIESDHWRWQCGQFEYARLPLPHLPIENAATALMVVQLLKAYFPIEEASIGQGLLQANLLGRFTRLDTQKTPPIYLDVAHNPAAANWLANRLAKEMHIRGFRRVYAVVAMLADKDILGTLKALSPHVDRWFVAEIDTPRAAAGQFIKQQLEAFNIQTCYTYASVMTALEEAINVSGNDTCIMVFGSFYTVAAALKFLQDRP